MFTIEKENKMSMQKRLELLEIKVKKLENYIDVYLNIKVDNISTHDIMKLSCLFFKIDKKKIVEKGRRQKICDIRSMIAAYMRTFKVSYHSIGRVLGNRDHSTVINMVNAHENQLDTNESYRVEYKKYLIFIQDKLEKLDK